MTLKHLFICDGCDREIVTPTNARPEDWIEARIEVKPSGDGGIPPLDLCRDCARGLDPREWPRTAACADEAPRQRRVFA